MSERRSSAFDPPPFTLTMILRVSRHERHFHFLENSPVIYGWGGGSITIQVPKGRQIFANWIFLSSLRTLLVLLNHDPRAKALGCFQPKAVLAHFHPRNEPRSWAQIKNGEKIIASSGAKAAKARTLANNLPIIFRRKIFFPPP